ncbi:hypothetical protein NFI96_024368 [Prochilodus magdalenae]|nr:hypothetical protein NFI96_024368 [Prochilodus magdalenae]
MTFLYSDAAGGGRKRKLRESEPSAGEGTNNIPHTKAPTLKKKKKGPVNQAKSPPEKPIKPGFFFSVDTFASRYMIGDKLEEGGFGSVFKGQRVSDGLQVAIKIVLKQGDEEYLPSPTDLKSVPLEVALLQRVNRPPVCKAVIKLIEWFDEPGRYILVLERPDPCMDLERFLHNHGQRLDEEKARAIMLQALEAVRHCSRRGVMHGDIKLENFLINTVTSEIKLIDFGCGSLIKGTGCDYAAGTPEYWGPEIFMQITYHAGPATVWSLGVLLFRLVCGYFPFSGQMKLILRRRSPFRDGLSYGKLNRKCRDLIDRCLRYTPSGRPSFEQVRQHGWFQCSVQA